MTAPIDLFLSIIIGASVALACRVQLRLSPQPWYATRYFAALAALEGMLYLPASAYRYFFHPDWSFMYVLGRSDNGGLLAVGALLMVAAAAVGTFWLGDFCSRTSRTWLLLVVLALAVSATAAIVLLGSHRLFLVGTQVQWEGTFGLKPLAESDLSLALAVMGGCVLVGWVYVLFLFVREATALSRSSR